MDIGRLYDRAGPLQPFCVAAKKLKPRVKYIVPIHTSAMCVSSMKRRRVACASNSTT